MDTKTETRPQDLGVSRGELIESGQLISDIAFSMVVDLDEPKFLVLHALVNGVATISNDSDLKFDILNAGNRAKPEPEHILLLEIFRKAKSSFLADKPDRR